MSVFRKEFTVADEALVHLPEIERTGYKKSREEDLDPEDRTLPENASNCVGQLGPQKLLSDQVV